MLNLRKERQIMMTNSDIMIFSKNSVMKSFYNIIILYISSCTLYRNMEG